MYTERFMTMNSHPLNLALRFVLEILALAAFAYWGWTQHTGLLRAVLALLVPILAGAVWGTFRVPGDPKDAPIAVPGRVRLLLEVGFFGSAVALLAAANQPSAALVFAIVTILHYLVSYDRVIWLMKQ